MPYDSDARDTLFRQLESVACSTEYPVDAIHFVYFSFPQHGAWEIEDRHITAKDLCWHLHDEAIAQFGGNALEQLDEWAIRSCTDFGIIVYALIGANLLAKNERDSREDFQDVFDFEGAFQKYVRPRHVGHQFRWRLSTMFLITTVAAIALVGFASTGVKGAAATVYCSWIALCGISCLLLGITDRRKEWVMATAMGVIFTVLGVGGFLFVTISLRE